MDLLREREEKFRHFYHGLQDAVVFTDMSGRLIEWNDAFRNLSRFFSLEQGFAGGEGHGRGSRRAPGIRHRRGA